MRNSAEKYQFFLHLAVACSPSLSPSLSRPYNFHPSLLSALNLVSLLSFPPQSPSPSLSLSLWLSESIRSVVRSMAEASPASPLSALYHNTSLQLTAGLQNTPYTHTGMQVCVHTHLRPCLCACSDSRHCSHPQMYTQNPTVPKCDVSTHLLTILL